MRWAGHVVRMILEKTVLRIFKATLFNKKPRRMPEKRCKDYVNEDCAILNVKKSLSAVWKAKVDSFR